MTQRPYLDPSDDTNVIAESVEAIETADPTTWRTPLAKPPMPKATRIYLDLSDILNTLIPEKNEIAYELVLRWRVKAEDISDVDEAQIINELNNWGDLDIISIEEITI